MTARKSTELDFRKIQKRQKTAISALRKFTEVYGTRLLKPAENLTEVYGTVTEVRPPLKGALPCRAPCRDFGRNMGRTMA